MIVMRDARIINPDEKTTDMHGRTIRPGDIVTHPRFGEGQIVRIDLKTYSLAFLVVDLVSGDDIFSQDSEHQKVG